MRKNSIFYFIVLIIFDYSQSFSPQPHHSILTTINKYGIFQIHPFIKNRHALHVNLVNKDKDDTENIEPIKRKEILSEDDIAAMIERTFIHACLQLAEGYIDILKLFIVTSKAAYERQILIPDLLQMVLDCPVSTANRNLATEEIELRSQWINLVYLTLGFIDQQQANGIISNENNNQYDSLAFQSVRQDIRNVFEGVSIKKVQENFNGSSSDIASSSEDPLQKLQATAKDDPTKEAILAYALKVIDLTITVVKEELKCTQKLIDETASGPPRPSLL